MNEQEVAGLRERLAASEKAREEAEMRLALKLREDDIEVEVHAATKRERDSYIKGYEAAESRAARLEEALAPFTDPERYNTAEEECRENKAMRWCAVHSFRWPCPVGPARAAIAAEEGK